MLSPFRTQGALSKKQLQLGSKMGFLSPQGVVIVNYLPQQLNFLSFKHQHKAL